MRQIGTIATETDAQRLGNYLLTLDISTRVESAPQGWVLWVHDEDRVQQARQALEEFVRNPEDPRYTTAAATAQALRNQAEQEAKRYQRVFIDLRRRWEQPAGARRPLTIALIVVSVLVAVASGELFRVEPRGEPDPILNWLHIASYYEDGRSVYWYRLSQIQHGQVWRLITPIFIHFGPVHLMFNMWCLHVFGGLIERRRGTWWLALLVLASAIVSNLAQYYWSGPTFGGMSGVVYGLLGYAWMKSRYDAVSGIYLHPQNVIVMIVWFFLCMTGWVGPIANAAHAGGLLTGLVIGYTPHLWRKLTRR
jgi:GlpG protein